MAAYLKAPSRFPLVILHVAALAAGLVNVNSSPAHENHLRSDLRNLFRTGDPSLDNGTLTANFGFAPLPAPERHTLPPAYPRSIVHQPYPPLAR